MFANNNRSKPSSQAVNKNDSSKVSKIENFRRKLFPLSLNNGKEILSFMFKYILRNGNVEEKQKDIADYLGVSRKSVNEWLIKAVKLKIFSKKKGTQDWDNRKQGINTHFLGTACYDLDKLRAIVELFPELGEYEYIYRFLIEKQGLQPTVKTGVTALKRIVDKVSNCTITDLNLNSNFFMKDNSVRVRRKFGEKWIKPKNEKPPVRLVKRTEEEKAQEKEKVLSLVHEDSKRGSFLRWVGAEVMGEMANKVSNNISSHKYV